MIADCPVLRAAATSRHRTFERLYGAALRFEADMSGIAFDRRLLARPFARTGGMTAFDYDRLVQAMNAHAPAQDLSVALEQVIASAICAGYPRIEWTAKQCGWSVRTLQRRIAAAGLSYSLLVERVRLTMAREMLGEPDTKIIDIAMDLGYTDPANFTHAFRRWTGVSPIAYRRAFGECLSTSAAAAAEPRSVALQGS